MTQSTHVGVTRSLFTTIKKGATLSGFINAPFSHFPPPPLILGVDPGLNGAMALLNRNTGQLTHTSRLPTFETATKSRKSGVLKHLDTLALARQIDRFSREVLCAAIEDPGAMPNQGLGSTFRFALTCGQIQGVLIGYNIPLVLVKPSVWKSALGLSQNKDDSLNLAERLYGVKLKKKDHDVAEAILIAHYAYKFMSA